MDTEVIVGIVFIAVVVLYVSVETFVKSRKRCPHCASGCWSSAKVCPSCGQPF